MSSEILDAEACFVELKKEVAFSLALLVGIFQVNFRNWMRFLNNKGKRWRQKILTVSRVKRTHETFNVTYGHIV